MMTKKIASVIPEGNQDWWKNAVFYQIYPRSYKDSNNDGNGDLKGATEKLDHIKNAGIDAIWLSPIFDSPMKDQGYDISNYYKVNPLFGDIEDLEVLIKEAHSKGIKVILDFVPNHTSNLHEWFQKSEARDPEFEDFYVWVDGTPDTPPNNWLSRFRHSAWSWSEKRQQWYLHQFLVEQPDLNYRNPKVLEYMQNVLRFYMDMGVDGFRVDAIPFLVEDKDLRDEPRSNNPDATPIDDFYLDHIYTQNLQETYEVIYSFRKTLDDYTNEHGGDARVMMTEAYADLNQMMLYYGTPDGSKLGAHFTFNFLLISNINKETSTAHDIQTMIYKWINVLPKIYTSNWVFGNHDNRRVPTRFGTGNKDAFNMIMALLPGIGVTYNGEEIGQEDGEVKYEDGQDNSARDPDTFEKLSRDFERTPFQWDSSINAGFNKGAKPWLPVSKQYVEINLQDEMDSDGLTHFKIYKALLEKRKEDVLREGTTDVWSLSDDVLVIKRSLGDRHVVLALKLGWSAKTQEETIVIPGISSQEALVSLTDVNSSYKVGSIVNPQNLVLKANEAVVLDVKC